MIAMIAMIAMMALIGSKSGLHQGEPDQVVSIKYAERDAKSGGTQTCVTDMSRQITAGIV